MTNIDMKAVELQKAEFDAVEKFLQAVMALNRTAVVDDDYPEMRHYYERSLVELIAAFAKNGRFNDVRIRRYLFDKETYKEGVTDGVTLQKYLSGLSFSTLRKANLARLPLFKNAQGGRAHTHPTGADWSPAEWLQATLGELGEAANLMKKLRRGDFIPQRVDHMVKELGKEFADVAIYLDILALQFGIDLGRAVADKWNETSEKIGVPLHIDYDKDQGVNVG